MSFLLYNFSRYKGSDFFVIDNSFFMFFLISVVYGALLPLVVNDIFCDVDIKKASSQVV